MARLQLAALAAVCLAVSASAALPTLPESGTLDNFIGTLMSSDIQAPITQPLGVGVRTYTTQLDLQDPSFTPTNVNDTNVPTQVHLSQAGPNAMYVQWSTGASQTGQGALTPLQAANSTASVVKYGTSASSLTSTANGSSTTYSQIYNTTVTSLGGASDLNYTSPLLHTVEISGLTPGQQYFYTVGDGQNSSAVFNFTALQAPGPNYPQRIIAMADWGLTANSSTTLQHALNSANESSTSPVVYYIADYCYADTWYPNGSQVITKFGSSTGLEGNPAGTFQPVWDSWMRFIQPLVSSVPFLGSTGNHEIEAQSDDVNTIFASVQARWHYPSAASKGTFFYYSANQGPVHGIFLSPYIDYTIGSAQWEWLYNDLRTIDRAVTPWVVVNIHEPFYSTGSSFKVQEQFRLSIEPLTYRYGVNVFLYGHVHAYERTSPVFDYNVNPCGAVHLTVGDAGNAEGLSWVEEQGLNTGNITAQYEDFGAGGCSVVANTSIRPSWYVPNQPNIVDHFPFFRSVLTYNANGNSSNPANASAPAGYCYAEQPIWSQYRDPSFGHGTLDILNDTTALWQFHRNQDGLAVVADAVYIVRDTNNCPNFLGQPITPPGLTGTDLYGAADTGAAYKLGAPVPGFAPGALPEAPSTTAGA